MLEPEPGAYDLEVAAVAVGEVGGGEASHAPAASKPGGSLMFGSTMCIESNIGHFIVGK